MDLLGVGRLPFFTRRNYYYEFKHLVPWSVFAGVVEGQFASVVVSKAFDGGAMLIAIATATPFAAFVLSLIWGMLCVGRPKVRLAMLFASASVLCAGTIGFIPKTPAGAVWFIVQIAAAQALLAGVVTVRSAIWKSNYPREERGRITARLQGIRSIIGVVTVQAAAALCEGDPSAYRLVYPAVAIIGVAGVLLLPRIRIRGERRELGRLSRPVGDGDLREGMIEPFSLTALLSPGHVLSQMVRVLREDRRFYHYCVAQFLHGVANLLTVPVIVLCVTQELRSGDRWDFWISTGLIVALPALALLATLSRWGRLLDAMGVLHMRVVNVMCWIVAILLGMFGTLTVIGEGAARPGYFLMGVGFFALRALVYGLAHSGGKLAWNLGHLHFARAEEAEVYMGIHVFLTGIRGLIAPLCGMWLWVTIGWKVWLISLGFALGSLILYTILARADRPVGSA